VELRGEIAALRAENGGLHNEVVRLHDEIARLNNLGNSAFGGLDNAR
jgi:cell division protein FtsB